MYKIKYSRCAVNQIPNLKACSLDKKVLRLVSIIKKNPYQIPPPYEKLQGSLEGLYSRRINIKHRLIYDVDENAQTVYIISMWTHYEQ
ncbi:MAG: Txe/YoeB family addiction module toxin [Acutalibacteraceae bacterium]